MLKYGIMMMAISWVRIRTLWIATRYPFEQVLLQILPPQRLNVTNWRARDTRTWTWRWKCFATQIISYQTVLCTVCHEMTTLDITSVTTNKAAECLSGWFGSDCLTYCVARNDTLGHYSCDANGQKRCLSNWYGQDCLVYCRATNSTLGHYKCDANGHKQCLNNWYGKDCLVYCKSRNDTQGHYICDSTGNIDCLPRWRGINCTEGEIRKHNTGAWLNFLSTPRHSPVQNVLSTITTLPVDHEQGTNHSSSTLGNLKGGRPSEGRFPILWI